MNKNFNKYLNYQTPFFLISKEKIAENLNNYKRLFPGSLIQFAMKANSEKEVLQTVLEAGGNFEVASKYELAMLQEIGVKPDRIVYGTSAKPSADIKEFFDYGVDRFSFDSFSELEKISIYAPKSKVYVRVAVNDKGSIFKFSEKFGTEKENIVPLLKKAKELGLHPYGISFHVGSQASDGMAWANAIKEIRDAVIELENNGIILDIINFGGGFPCNDYLSSEGLLSLEEIAYNTLQEFNKLPYQPQIMLEPGRGIIANTAVVVVSVIAKIERKELTWLFLDAGVYNGLFESMSYQGSIQYKISPLNKTTETEMTSFALAGPTGDSPDVITREVFLPKNFGVGDKLVIYDVGAYSLPTVSLFNGFPKPPVYYFDTKELKNYTINMHLNIYQKICLAFFVVLTLYWSIIYSFGLKESFDNYLYSFLFGLIPFVSGFIAMIRSRYWGGFQSAIGKAVFFIGLGIFLWGCGEIIWSYYNFFLNVSAPYPSLADLGFAPSIFFYGLGTFYLSKATGAKFALRDKYSKIIVLFVSLAVVILSYYLLIIFARGGVIIPEGETFFKSILDVAYPLGDFIALMLGIVISGLSFKYLGGKYTLDIYLILLGLGVMFAADTIFSYTTTMGTYYNANVGDLMLSFGTFLLSFGILGFFKLKVE